MERGATYVAVVLAVLMIGMLYPSSYFLLVDRGAGIVGEEYRPVYRVGGLMAIRVFEPMYWLDLQIRPQYWDCPRAIQVPLEEFGEVVPPLKQSQ
jgi:hypothetical protein